MSEEEFYTVDLSGDDEHPSPEPRRMLRHLFQIGAAVAALVGLFYISGPHQIFFFQRTPEEVVQEPIRSALDVATLTVPLNMIILVNDGVLGSRRSQENALRLAENASRVWEQANVILEVVKTGVEPVTDAELGDFFASPQAFVRGFTAYDPQMVNVFLIGTLRGINGISFGGVHAVAVADRTTVFDFRALAHEIGHQLGLGHVPDDQGRLMFRGANGVTLSIKEIMRAREIAEDVFGVDR